MTKTLPVLLASLLAVSSATAPLQVLAQQTQSLDRIAAIVDEDVVLQSELDRAVQNIKAQYAGREHQLPPDDVLNRQVLERLVPQGRSRTQVTNELAMIIEQLGIVRRAQMVPPPSTRVR